MRDSLVLFSPSLEGALKSFVVLQAQGHGVPVDA